MSDSLRIITNNVPRDVVQGYELSMAERGEFDYYDWSLTGPIVNGESSPEFFRYKGTTYDLGEFFTTSEILESGEASELRKWDGYQSDSFFSGLVVRYVEDNERVIVGRYYS